MGMQSAAARVALIGAALAVLVVLVTIIDRSGVTGEQVVPSSWTGTVAAAEIDADELLASVLGRVRDDGGGQSAGDRDQLSLSTGPVYVALRSGGILEAEAWGEGDDLGSALDRALAEALQGTSTDFIDTVEVAVSHSFQRVDSGDRGPFTNVHRGVRGLELRHGETLERYSPTWMLATNRNFDRTVDLFLEARGLGGRDDIAISVFDAVQYIVDLESGSVTQLERGNTYVPVTEVDRDRVIQLRSSLADWLEGAVHDDGRLTYKYWPSNGRESQANNMIRQWMGTTALIREARYRDSGELWDVTRRNIAYNLEQFFERENDLGLIVEDGTKVKLGAVALAGRALLEHRDADDYREHELALRRMVDHLWHEDGSFKTWYLPADATGQENFYPGEALYYWSALLTREFDEDLLDRFMRSFEHYRAWHLDENNRNPAFVPWHTQAYYEVWRLTENPALADFIFEMNDWLLDMQQWDDVVYRDTRGRFYDPTRPHFGVPHSSSTGVYLEGLIDAYSLASELDEVERAEAYRIAIVRGLRSVMQLQFRGGADTYYISRPERVVGGVRTTVYDNEIRVDNVQHNLMAVQKILDRFAPEDFDHPDDETPED
jgi:hypothetical protein